MWNPLVVLDIVVITALIRPSGGTELGPYPQECNDESPHRKCKNPNEIYDLCPNPCPPKECGVDKALILCAPAPKPGSNDCKPRCVCEDGYAKNRAGICIPEDECKYDCAKNETLDLCYSSCPPRYCGVNIAAISCPVIDECDCELGCRCRNGYLRNAKGDCVLKKDCPKCRGPNEMYDLCPNPCPPQRCDVDPRVIRCPAPPEPGDSRCKPGCRCIDGYARNDDDKCVPRDKCPQNSCKGDHEVYSRCPALVCQPQNCTQIGFPQPCPDPGPDPSRCPGKPGCICETGYARNSSGNCIPVEQCPSCRGDPKAVYGCGGYCGRRCSDRNRTEPVVCTAECRENSCDCRKGYWYDDNTGKCVLSKDCTPTCGKDQVYNPCINGDCGPQKCSELGYSIPCPRIDPNNCIKGCSCREGYVRANNGTCIPKEKCPSCGGDPNAVSGCGINCGRLCSNYNSTEPVACIEICYLNGCDCKKGYVLDDSTRKCIRPYECVSCGGDINAKPGCDEDCSKRCPGPKPTECKCYKGGCECKDGFVYDAKLRKCVHPEKCTPSCGNNEVLSNCSNSGCGPWCCTDVGFPTGCVKMDQKYCKVGCVCKEGYVKDENENCIPITECPECGGDPNAIAGCGINCGRLCSNYKQAENISCIALCKDNACDCRKGLVLDENINKCVRPKDCTPTCGKDQVYNPCINGDCGPQKCSELGYPIPCPRIDPNYCIKGCSCREGYVRANNGSCIPKEKCPSCGGDPNAVSGCGINCGRLCSNYNSTEPVACIEICYLNGCDCKKGYVLDDSTGKCIRPYECVSCGGDINAKPGCDEDCSKRCPGPKPTECKCYKGGCECKDGFVYDAKLRKCVRPEKCTPVCGNNEVFSDCVNGGCQAKNCSQIGQPIPSVKPAKCRPGCLCAEDYLRDDKGVCIPKDKCPQKCKGANEIYDPCPPTCPPQTCESIGRKYSCPLMPVNKTSEDCHGACRCKPNFYRNKSGECVSAEDCRKCGKNERFEECPAKLCSPQSCKDLGFEILCETNDSKPCPGPPGYVCDHDFVRNEKGKCIPKKECASCGGDYNAESGCGLNCGRLCSNYDKGPAPCPRICYPNACDCKKDFVFDENIKKCVRPEQCTPMCKKHEVYSECINGECKARNCSQLGKPVPCIKLDPNSCIKGCVCEDGYLRARNGTCVLENKCDNCNKPHEYWDPCEPSCPPQTCESIGRQYKCLPTAAVCKGACRCEQGYFRNKLGDCILKENCLKCNGPHEFWSCGGACDNVCADLKEQNQTNCPIINIKCNEMCYCEEGYARNADNVCIPIDKCPPICGKNEIYSSCANGGCGKWNCSQLGHPDLCINVIECIGGCICQKGFLRTKNGTCVPINQCPTPTCGKNERFEFCPDSVCEPKSCSELGFPLTCPNRKRSSCAGEPACICDHGYVRDDKGVCIAKKKCPSCGGDSHAESGCGINCGRLCSNYNKGPVPCPKICKVNACDCKKGYVYDSNTKKCVRPKNCTPICGKDEVFSKCINAGCKPVNCSQLGKPVPCPKIDKKDCIKGCLCKQGYFRKPNGDCVPKEKCGPPKCGKNERLENCPDWLCTPQSCSQVGYPVACPALQGDNNSNATCPGTPGCVCIDNYARNDSGKCIPINECPSCGGDPNAIYGCGINCGRLCSNYKEKNVACPLICRLNSCDCKKGYVYDSNIGKCVLPKDCTPTCRPNEVYDTCANGGCQKRNCSQSGGPTLCIDPIKCEGGCVCQEGYLRTEDGECILEKKCPIQCTKAHEVYDPCSRTCPPQTCAAIGIAYPCPRPPEGEEFCVPACRCEDGYYRNSVGECISEEDCSKCTGPNEHFACGPVCDNECATLSTKNQTNCPYVNKRCNSKCYCDEGYARDANNVCVPFDQCEMSCHGDPNAIPGCGGHCGNRCSNYKKKIVACPLSCILDGCDCKKGYIFDDNTGKCVLPKNCTPVCGKDEVYNTCINGGCQKKKCSDLGRPDICAHPKECIGGCLCKEGMLRADNGTCVPINKCPTPTCPRHEVFDRCANRGCNRRKCSELTGPIICKDPIECVGDCVCVKGYLRNEDGVCVRERQCNPQCYKPHQVFNWCPSQCSPQTCESLGRAYICPIEWGEVPPCEPDCVCEEGYFFNLIGECISEEDCLKCPGKHEYFSCGGACDNVCASLDKNKTNCPIINIKCNEKCYCEDGYARNDKNSCIPIEQCPIKCNGKHRVFDPCPRRPRTCESFKYLDSCESESESESGSESESSEEEKPCEPSCVCKKGYYENAKGECVTKKECSSQCRPDERYVEKPCRLCEPLTCCEVGKDFDCSSEEYDDCDLPPACICKKGLVRNKNGDCIPISECPSETSVNVTDARARLDQGSVSLSGKFLHFLAASNPEANSVASPTSVLVPLAQLALKAKGLVLEQLLKLLNLKSKEEIKACFPGLIAEFSNQTNVDFNVATKVYSNVKYPLNKTFIRDSEKYFGASGENVDFSKAKEAADIINKWVYNQTRGKIQDLVNSNMFNADTRLCLVNAIYFLGNWVKQFNPNDTKFRDFYKSNGETVPLKIMYQQNTFNYAETDQHQVLEMFYKGNNFSFIVVLPRKKEDLLPTLKAIQEPGVWSKMMDSLRYEKCKVYLPKMLINTQIDIKKLLIKYNVDKMFDPSYDGFEGILEKPEPVYISDAVQKAFMNVDETGTEAAVATALIGATTTAIEFDPPKIFEALRSYIYYIVYKGVPLFAGTFVGAT